MPSFKTYHNGKAIYSVDMMIAYVNTHTHPVKQIPIEEFLTQLEASVWGDWSPMTVIEKIDVKKYKENADRIRHADISYPIFITTTNTILDGYHRVAKAYMDGQKTIKAYVFDPSLMKKFILDKDMNFVRVHKQMSVADILELWNKKFC